MSDTSIRIKSLNPRWVLEKAGYSKHPGGKGWIRQLDGKNRFHAYYQNFTIHLHYDKYTVDGHHSAHHVELAHDEARILTGIEAGTITQDSFDECKALPLTDRDVDFVLSRVKKRPRYIPKSLYRKLIYFLIDLK